MPDRLPLSVRRVYCIHTLFFCSAFVMWSLRPAGSVAHLELIACNVFFVFFFFSPALQSHKRPARWEMEENAEWRTAGVYHAGQSPRRRTETTQPRLLEAQTNQLGKKVHTESRYISTHHPPHLWTLALRASGFSFLHRQSEWVMVSGPHLWEKPGHTRAHTF